MGRKKLLENSENMKNSAENPEVEGSKGNPAENMEAEGSKEAPAKEMEAEGGKGNPTENSEVEGNKEASAENPEAEGSKEASAEDPEAERTTKSPLGEQKKDSDFFKGEIYKITCCNPINETFGGVSFYNGVAHTNDSFTASWFRNKKGYVVKKE